MEKTTLELPRKEWKKYNPFIGLERSLKKDHIEVEQRKSKAWEIALQAANLLKNNFGDFGTYTIIIATLSSGKAFNIEPEEKPEI